MRGKVAIEFLKRNSNRITPAYAGKSALQSPQNPRSSGSPPPMRGKDSRGGVKFDGDGITPAYAGKSGRVCGLKICRRDHPRLCGEKLLLKLWEFQHTGSPPPMRGKVRVGEAYSRAYRITPAYAGKRRLW